MCLFFFFFLFATLMAFVSAQTKVLIIHSTIELLAHHALDVETKLINKGFSVTMVNVGLAITPDPLPTVTEMQAHDVVFTWSQASYPDPVALGDNLADYVNAGGRVVVAVGAFSDHPTSLGLRIGGRFRSDGMEPIVAGALVTAPSQILVPVAAGHPLLAGVSSFNGRTAGHVSSTTVAPRAVRVADAAPDGTVLIAAFDASEFGGPIVALNFIPPSNEAGPPIADSEFWDASTDGVQIMANALNFLGTAPASASGDPHLIGPHNERFDFDGEPNGVYALFTTPQFVVNMKLHPEGPKTRFIHEIGIVFRNVSMLFNTQSFDVTQKSMMLNKKLTLVGGRAIVTPFNIELELCDGHQIHISQRMTNFKFPNKATQRFYHLDVSVQVPGCHDSFGGALGQTYQCKYNREKFVFNHDQEASFRLNNLFQTSGSFDSNSPCHDQRVYVGQDPMNGGLTSMSMDHTQ